MNRCARLTGGIRTTSWAIRKWKRCSQRSTVGTRMVQQMPTEVVFGIDREGKPHHGPQIAGYAKLKDDGSTASGTWIYSGVLGPDGINKANARKPHNYLGHGWGFVWPGDRRIIYNRASAAPTGEPWSERKKLVWWDAAEENGLASISPISRSKNRQTSGRPETRKDSMRFRATPPFILHEDGLGWLHVAKGLQDGPMPTHYEPLESPVRNALYTHDTNPVGQLVYPPGKSFRAAGRSAISVCPNDLSADRASYRRRHVAFPQSSRGIATGTVRGNVPRTRRSS